MSHYLDMIQDLASHRATLQKRMAFIAATVALPQSFANPDSFDRQNCWSYAQATRKIMMDAALVDGLGLSEPCIRILHLFLNILDHNPWLYENLSFDDQLDVSHFFAGAIRTCLHEPDEAAFLSACANLSHLFGDLNLFELNPNAPTVPKKEQADSDSEPLLGANL